MTIRFRATCALSALLFTGAPAASSTPPAYEAHVERREGIHVTRAHILYDRGKFRETMFPGSSQNRSAAGHVLLYDGKMVWEYRPGAQSATPGLSAIMHRLVVLTQQLGVKTVVKRYQVPASLVHHYAGARVVAPGRPRPVNGLRTRADIPGLPEKPAGSEQIAGYPCQKYEILPRPGSQQPTIRAWIEPRTGLVLQWEQVTTPLPDSPVPPMRMHYVVRKLRLLRSLPPETFHLPPGTTAHLPEIFRDAPLPPGVKRVPLTGKAAKTGILF